LKGYAAPSIIVVILSIFTAAAGVFYYKIFSQLPIPDSLRWIIVVGTLAVIAALVAVLIQRIKELKRGEEDDLGKY